MPVTIQFRFRPVPKRAGLSDTYRYLHLRITVNGVRDAGFAARYRFVHQGDGSVSFGEMIAIDSSRWNAKTAQLRGRDLPTLEINSQIDNIKFAIKDVCAKQQQRYDQNKAPRPTTDSVKFEYQYGLPPSVENDGFVYPSSFLKRKKTAGPKPTKQVRSPQAQTSLTANSLLLDVFASYLIDIQVNQLATGKMAKSTYSRRLSAYQYVKAYPPAEMMPIGAIHVYWVEVLHSWMLRQPAGNAEHKVNDKRLSVGTATAYCRTLVEIMDWLKKQRILPVNPLVNLDLPRNPTKDVYFLEAAHLERLFAIRAEPPLSISLWWFKLICLTGLDYPDAVRYARARNLYEARTPKGRPKIVIRRSKKPYNECNIPVLEELNDLWDEVGGDAPQKLHDATIIKHLDENDIAEKIGFTHKLTPKIARKSAGTLFLRGGKSTKGLSIKSVSNVLGHSSIGVTERNYVKVTGAFVDHELDS